MRLEYLPTANGIQACQRDYETYVAPQLLKCGDGYVSGQRTSGNHKAANYRENTKQLNQKATMSD